MDEKEYGVHQQVLSARDGDFVGWNGQIRLQSALREHGGGAIILSKYHGFHPEGNGELLKSGLLLSLLLLQRSNNIRFLKNIPLTDETG